MNMFIFDNSSFTVFDVDQLNSKDVSGCPKLQDLTPIDEHEMVDDKSPKFNNNWSLDLSKEMCFENLMSEQDEFIQEFTEQSFGIEQ